MNITYPKWEEEKHDLESTICTCEPKVYFYENELFIIHNAFDGRHLEEQINEILNDKKDRRIK